jgi:probable rRNA maturation factor
MAQPKTISSWTKLAEKRLSVLLAQAQRIPAIRKRGPRIRPWTASVKLIGLAEMRKLNKMYRGKGYATDILSFHPPKVFQKNGFLGELVICLPVLKSQARGLKHPAVQELDVLLAHGILHLLGLDHERGKRQAAAMANLEAALLEETPGLIRRNQ